MALPTGFAAAEIVPGADVFASTHVKVVAESGEAVVAVRWGDTGRVLEWREGLWLVAFPQRHRGGQEGHLLVSPCSLALEEPKLRQGQWVTFARDIELASSRMIRSGSPAIVLDVRLGGGGPTTVLVRAAEMTRCKAFELAVSLDELEPLPHVPAGLQIEPDELPGGFHIADVVFAEHNINVADGPDGTVVTCVGRGDNGMVFGPGLTPDARAKGDVLVRFDARQDSLRPVWLSVQPSSVSRTRPIIRGHTVTLTTGVRFPDGTVASKGTNGVLIETDDGVGGQNLVRVGTKCFNPPGGSITAAARHPPVNDEERYMRLEMLEKISKENEAAGVAEQTVSLIEQNLWEIFGHGLGMNISFLAHHGRGRITIIADENRTMLLKYHASQGLDGTLGNETVMGFNHNALMNDKGRNRAYQAAIQRCARGRRALDIGTGPAALLARLCLRGGASSVDAVENTEQSVVTAAAAFRAEASGAQHKILPDWATLPVAEAEALGNDGCLGARLSARLAVNGGETQEIKVFRGLSSDTSLGLSGGYSMLVHEILGDMAGTEGAAAVVADIHRRSLVTEDCLFVPRSSATMLAPTAALTLDTTTTLLHRWGNRGAARVAPMTRVQARNFPETYLLAPAQPLELLDFQHGPELLQERSLEFRTDREADFDGVHLHLHVDLDGEGYIDVLEQHNTTDREINSNWSTMYVRLLAEPIRLPAGSRINVRCHADLREQLARYRISAAVGEEGQAREVAEFEWSGG